MRTVDGLVSSQVRNYSPADPIAWTHGTDGCADLDCGVATCGDAAMRHFYVETLGLEPRSDRPGFVNFDFGQSRLTIATHDRVSGTAADPSRVMVNLRTADIQTAVSRCDPSQVIRWPEREKWGGMVATVTDPDGNFVQFLQME